MGFGQAAVLASVSFFLGVQFINFNVDHRVLFEQPTEETIQTAYQYYTTFFNAPLAVKALMHTMMAIGFSGLFSKLHKWDDSAKFFDGTCLAMYLFGVVMYIAVTIPALRTVVTPLAEDTDTDRFEALRVLAAGNTIVILCLAGVLLMQAGQEYARRYEEREYKKLGLDPEVEREKDRLAQKAAREAQAQANPSDEKEKEKKDQ
jgi:hypothetical protein